MVRIFLRENACISVWKILALFYRVIKSEFYYRGYWYVPLYMPWLLVTQIHSISLTNAVLSQIFTRQSGSFYTPLLLFQDYIYTHEFILRGNFLTNRGVNITCERHESGAVKEESKKGFAICYASINFENVYGLQNFMLSTGTFNHRNCTNTSLKLWIIHNIHWCNCFTFSIFSVCGGIHHLSSTTYIYFINFK